MYDLIAIIFFIKHLTWLLFALISAGRTIEFAPASVVRRSYCPQRDLQGDGGSTEIITVEPRYSDCTYHGKINTRQLHAFPPWTRCGHRRLGQLPDSIHVE